MEEVETILAPEEEIQNISVPEEDVQNNSEPEEEIDVISAPEELENSTFSENKDESIITLVIEKNIEENGIEEDDMKSLVCKNFGFDEIVCKRVIGKIILIS